VTLELVLELVEDEEGGGGPPALTAAASSLGQGLHPPGVRGGEVIQQVLNKNISVV